VGTKLTEEEFARLESLAAASGQSVSEWAREALLAATTPTPTNPSNNQNQDAVLGEVLALRAIVLNLFYELAAGERITVERMKEIIGRADAKKGQLAPLDSQTSSATSRACVESMVSLGRALVRQLLALKFGQPRVMALDELIYEACHAAFTPYTIAPHVPPRGRKRRGNPFRPVRLAC
jgi:hypothetical protein